jgi:hypothetical protein
MILNSNPAAVCIPVVAGVPFMLDVLTVSGLPAIVASLVLLVNCTMRHITIRLSDYRTTAIGLYF